MKVLHISDLHLGVKTEGRDRIPEQKRILDEICDIADAQKIDIVLIAGDVFQNAVPSAEAEDVFFAFIEKISHDSNRVIIVIAGNHDDPKRLVAGQYLAKKHNVLLIAGLEEPKSFQIKGSVQIIETGVGYAKIKKGDELAVVAFLPYPVDSRIKYETDKDLTYSQKVKQWAMVGASHFEKKSFNIFVSHLYLAGALLSESNKDEVVKLGEALSVEKAIIPKADYIALGHLHTSQCVDAKRNIYYSGATAMVRYTDSKPSVLVASKVGKNTVVEKIMLQSPVTMAEIGAVSVQDAMQKLKKFSDQDIISLTITQEESLKQNEIRELKKDNPCLCDVRLKLTSNKSFSNKSTSRKKLEKRELFNLFYQKKKGELPSTKLTELFIELMEDKNETN